VLKNLAPCARTEQPHLGVMVAGTSKEVFKNERAQILPDIALIALINPLIFI
jgi:hypothetical protein